MSATAPALSSRAVEEVRAEQVRMLYANGGFPLLATFMAASILAAVLVGLGGISLRAVGIWLTVMAAHTIGRLWLRSRYFRARRAAAEWRRWLVRYNVGVVAGALTWGVGTLFLMPPGRFDLQLLIVLTLLASAYASLATFGSVLTTFYMGFLASMLPSAVWSLFQDDAAHYAYSALSLIWLPAVLVLARRYSGNLTQAITLRHAYAEQKAIAEQASVAKSRFLASASHDLRQPVHALGMFLGALRSERLTGRSKAILDHMDTSISALDELFTSLLDISRLDAGATDTNPCAMPMQPLLVRICREVEAEAHAKGLRVTVAATSLTVRSDPMLLERILRNLLVNAVRYTDRGHILIGCRRRGDRVSLEVWDTGRGIAPEQREAVFEEFYQVANPERDRAKGLGLGLPIVQRLAAMLDHPLTVESEPGKGSVFKVLVPRAAPMPEAPAVAGEPVLPGVRSALIVAIDDEAEVRAAMTQLLGSWGHQVIAAASGDEAVEALANSPARPDLIICDCRLREGEKGIDVVGRLQSEFNAEIPALLVTGDTAPERILEAEASGYPLLHKPLSHGRLRAAVTALISAGAAEPATVE